MGVGEIAGRGRHNRALSDDDLAAVDIIGLGERRKNVVCDGGGGTSLVDVCRQDCAEFVAALSSKNISALAANTFLSIAAILLLLLSTRSSVFAAVGTSFTDITLSAGLNENGFAF